MEKLGQDNHLCEKHKKKTQNQASNNDPGLHNSMMRPTQQYNATY